jgi:hypothetical protein
MSRGTSTPATCRRPSARLLPRSRRLALVTAAILGTSVLFAAPALATNGPPVIESMSASAGGEIAVGADINPDGLETSYEIWLECPSCDPSDQKTAGLLPAVNETRAVTLVLSGLQPGQYWFAVLVRNGAGEASQRSDILEVPASPGSFPNGTAPVGVVRAPYLGEAAGQLKAIAEQHTREQDEQHAKEQEAQRTEDQLAAQAAERQHREAEEAAAAVAQRRARVCVVPSLRGTTLSAAGHALANAHCHLGKVSRPRRHHGMILVTRQDPRPGETLPAGGGVTLTLGAKRASHR